MKNLHAIGKRIAGLKTDHQRGREPLKLAGSSKLPNGWNYSGKPAKVKLTKCVPFEDKRFKPDPGYEGVFSSTFPGIDPLTNKPWN